MFPVKPSSIQLSAGLHALLVLLALFGLPALLPARPDPTPLVMSVEVLPISDVSNVKPSEEKIQKEQHASTPKIFKPTPPSVTEKPKEAKEPKPTSTPPTPPKPTEKAPAPEKHFDPSEGKEPKPAEKPKPEEAAKPAEKQNAEEFAALLNKLKQETPTAPTKDAKDATNTPENKTRSDAPYDASLPLSISERDAIRSQFVQCWRMPAGAKAGESLAVRIKVEVLEDGTVKTAAISSDQQSRYGSDTYFRAAADSALRAVHKCSPLKNLPQDKFKSWSEMELTFDPKDML